MTASFVQGCLDALEHHFDALDALQDDTDDNKAIAMRALERCGNIATSMAKETDIVVMKVTEMETNAEDALVEAKKSQVTTVEEKKAVEKMRDEASSRKKRREAEIKELNDNIADLQQQEIKFKKKADRESARANKMMLLKAVCGMAATIAAGPMSVFATHDDSDAGTTTSNGQPDTSDQEIELRRNMDQQSSRLAEQEVEVKRIEREIEDLKKEGDSTATAEECIM